MDFAAGDGVFASNQGGDINLVDLKSNTTTKLVTMHDVKDVRDLRLSIDTMFISRAGARSPVVLVKLGAVVRHEVHPHQVGLS